MAIIGALPYTLLPNTLADATQVQADFDWIVSQVNANVPAAGKVYVSGNSSLLGYLSQVLVAGSGIALNILNSGGAETFSVSSTSATVQLADIQAAVCSF